MQSPMDLETGEIRSAQEGVDAAVLIPLLKRLMRTKVQLKAVAMDKSKPMAKTVRQAYGFRDMPSLNSAPTSSARG